MTNQCGELGVQGRGGAWGVVCLHLDADLARTLHNKLTTLQQRRVDVSLLFHILVTSQVISRWVPTCESAHSW